MRFFPSLLIFLLIACGNPGKEDLGKGELPDPEMQSFQDSVRLDDDVRKALAHEFFIRGLSMKQGDSPELAAMFYEKALEHDPGNRFLAFETAELMQRTGNDSEALVLLKEKLPNLDSLSGSQNLLLARLFRANKQADSSIVHFSKAVEHGQDDPHVLFEYAMLLESLNRYEELAKVNHRLIPRLGFPRQMLEKQFLLLRILGDTSSLRQLTEAAWRHHGDFAYGNSLARLQLQSGDTKAARRTLDELREKDPDNHTLRLEISRLYILDGETDSALAMLRALSAENPENHEYLEKTAQLEFETGQRDSAEAHFGALVRIVPNNHLAHFYISTLSMMRDPKKAKHHILKALEIRPEEAVYRQQLAAIYYLHHEYKEAYAILDSLLQTNPASPLPWRFRAMVLLHEASWINEQEKHDGSNVQVLELRKQAVDFLLQALKRDSTNADLLFDLAANYERIGQSDLAISLFQKLIRLYPKHHRGLNYLGYTLLEEKGDTDAAGKLIDRALQLDPSNLAYLDSKAWHYYKIGKYAEALEVLEFILKESDEVDPIILEHLALVLEHLKKRKRATETWERILKLNPLHPMALQYLDQNK